MLLSLNVPPTPTGLLKIFLDQARFAKQKHPFTRFQGCFSRKYGF